MSAPPKALRGVGNEAPHQAAIAAGTAAMGGVDPGHPGALHHLCSAHVAIWIPDASLNACGNYVVVS